MTVKEQIVLHLLTEEGGLCDDYVIANRIAEHDLEEYFPSTQHDSRRRSVARILGGLYKQGLVKRRRFRYANYPYSDVSAA